MNERGGSLIQLYSASLASVDHLGPPIAHFDPPADGAVDARFPHRMPDLPVLRRQGRGAGSGGGVRAALLVVGFLLAPPSMAMAQDTPIVDLSGGYSFLWDDDGHALNGWYATVALNMNRWFALAADASGHYRSQQIPPIPELGVTGGPFDHDVVAFMGGPRVTLRRTPRLAAFAHLMVGQVTAESEFMGIKSSNGEAAFETGGGVDIWLARRAGIRVGADYRYIFYEDDDGSGFRFHTGVVFGLGAW